MPLDGGKGGIVSVDFISDSFSTFKPSVIYFCFYLPVMFSNKFTWFYFLKDKLMRLVSRGIRLPSTQPHALWIVCISLSWSTLSVQPQ